MDIQNCLLKKIERPSQNYDGKVFVLAKDNKSILTLNEISAFLWKNCQCKDIDTLVHNLISACNSETKLDFNEVKMDCVDAVDTLIDSGLIKILTEGGV